MGLELNKYEQLIRDIDRIIKRNEKRKYDVSIIIQEIGHRILYYGSVITDEFIKKNTTCCLHCAIVKYLINKNVMDDSKYDGYSCAREDNDNYD